MMLQLSMNVKGYISVAYLFVMISLVCLAVKGYCGKKVGCWMRDSGDAVLFNLLRMAICAVIGIGLTLVAGESGFLSVDGGMLGICLFAGAANATFLVFWLLAIQKNAMVTVDVCLTIGSILPAILCAILFGEAISPIKLIGFVLILVATVILAGYNKSTVGHVGILGVLFLVLAGLGDGLAGFSQQLYKHYYTESGVALRSVYPKSIYHFYTYLFATLLLLLVYIGYRVYRTKHQGTQTSVAERKPFEKRALPVIAVMALCMFGATYFQTVATNDYGMVPQVLYPMIKGGCLITVNVTASVFFGEKITARSILGSCVALVGMVIMNLW